MALRWLEGNQGCQNTTIFGRLYAALAGAVGSTLTDQFGRTIIDASTLVLTTPVLVGVVENTWVIGFRFNVTSGTLDAAPSAFPGVALHIAGGEQVRLEVVDTSPSGVPGAGKFKLRVMRGATELARTVDEFSQNNSVDNWTYFEWKVVVNTSTNGSFSLRWDTHKSRNNTATWDASTTGINTANQGSAGADRAVISWATGSADRVSIYDLYILDSTGAVNNDFLGEIYIEALDPDGTGTTNQWDLAGGAASVEDALNEGASTQSVSEDDKGCTSDIVGELTLATLSNLNLITNTTIVGVQVRMYGKMDTTGTRDVEFFYRKTTGTPAQIGSGTLLLLDSTSFEGKADTLEEDPNTTNPWVIADINAMQVGFELDA